MKLSYRFERFNVDPNYLSLASINALAELKLAEDSQVKQSSEDFDAALIAYRSAWENKSVLSLSSDQMNLSYALNNVFHDSGMPPTRPNSSAGDNERQQELSCGSYARLCGNLAIKPKLIVHAFQMRNRIRSKKHELEALALNLMQAEATLITAIQKNPDLLEKYKHLIIQQAVEEPTEAHRKCCVIL